MSLDEHNNACVRIAGDMISGFFDKRDAVWKAECSTNPDLSRFKATVALIISSWKLAGRPTDDVGFVCKGS